MKKQKSSYSLMKFGPSSQKRFVARREISYELKLSARLVLDELVYKWNKVYFEQKMNYALDNGDKAEFMKWAKLYEPYTWE
ncbi:hypothetical protein [Salirhabdus salicampi]|uniref:hypothetical protein n=1 Tax=Salirhabdus salicampi TaxID=476102 RepID=UPI0020C27254|nr:hypothetical protein [Salirhabdus salicampi]MCP8615480.1 hypothetical protein [Salirhabdus salicampi]